MWFPISMLPGKTQWDTLHCQNSDASLYTIKDSGVYLEKRFAGVRFLSVKGLNTGTLDMSENLWGHKVIITWTQKKEPIFVLKSLSNQSTLMFTLQVGLEGERLLIFTEKGAKKVKWSSAQASQPLTWYKVSTNILLSIASLRIQGTIASFYCIFSFLELHILIFQKKKERERRLSSCMF